MRTFDKLVPIDPQEGGICGPATWFDILYPTRTRAEAKERSIDASTGVHCVILEVVHAA
ncbi:MAG: hypothetical protein ACHP7O_10550 [Burkholderiales bacterium]